MPIRFKLNTEEQSAEVRPGDRLLYLLRNEFGLTAAKFGCGLGECGACTVLVDGKAARSCILPAQAVAGREVTTLEGLSCEGALHPVQQAFVEAQGAQCGYCLNGMIMTLTAFLNRRPDADEAALCQALRHNLCRCGAHIEIIAAALRAVELMKARRHG